MASVHCILPPLTSQDMICCQIQTVQATVQLMIVTCTCTAVHVVSLLPVGSSSRRVRIVVSSHMVTHVIHAYIIHDVVILIVDERMSELR